MTELPFSEDYLDADFMAWVSELTPGDAPSRDMWGELEHLLDEPTRGEQPEVTANSPPATGNAELPLTVEALFAEPEVAPPVPEVAVSPTPELPLPPLVSPQGLWAEIGHLFQTPAFSDAVPPPPPSSTLESEIDTLSQAMLANDGDTIQALVHQIQQTYGDRQSIEIFLAATRNLCC